MCRYVGTSKVEMEIDKAVKVGSSVGGQQQKESEQQDPRVVCVSGAAKDQQPIQSAAPAHRPALRGLQQVPPSTGYGWQLSGVALDGYWTGVQGVWIQQQLAEGLGRAGSN
jgi:hypothetical protein